MRGVLPNALAGLTVGFLVIVLSISAGSLLFAGELRAFVPVSVGISLAGACALSLVAALTTPIRGVATPIEEAPAIALAAIVGGVVHAMPDPAMTDRATLVTIVVAVALATVLCGVFCLVLGAYRLGGFVRFMPYPVIGGFLAGTGGLIVLGGVAIIAAAPVSPELLGNLGGILPKLVVAGVFVAAMMAAQLRFRSPLAVPATVAAAVVAFDVVVLVAGAPRPFLRAEGWLVGLPEGGGDLWPPFEPAELALVDWGAVAHSMIHLPTVLLLMAVSVLLNATGIGLQQREEVDLDRELVSVGWMNVASGGIGSLPGFGSVSLTTLANRLGGSTRVVSLVIAALCLATLLLGSTIIDIVPAFVLGGLLVWVGGQLVVEWLVLSHARVDRWEHAVIVLIFLTIVGAGFTTGVIVGIAAAVVVFVVRYGQVDIVRHALTAAEHQGAVDAIDHRHRQLRRHGDAILIVRLQGYLFFGTADRLLRRIRDRLGKEGTSPVRFVVLDFSRVTGLDSSTVLSFTQLRQFAQKAGLNIVLAGLDARTCAALRRGGLVAGKTLQMAPDAQTAIRLAEDALLASLETPAPHTFASIDEVLSAIVSEPATAAGIGALCERLEVPAGETLIEQGKPCDELFFVASGHAAVLTASDTGAQVRLDTVGPGGVIGEIAFYLQTARSATIVAEAPLVVWRLTRSALGALEASEPHVAAAFHAAMARMLSQRIVHTDHLVRFLAD